MRKDLKKNHSIFMLISLTFRLDPEYKKGFGCFQVITSGCCTKNSSNNRSSGENSMRKNSCCKGKGIRNHSCPHMRMQLKLSSVILEITKRK